MKTLILFFTIFPLIAMADCGQIGTIQDRIQDCATTQESFQLVSRTGEEEIWKDSRTHLVWSDLLEEQSSHREAQKLCESISIIPGSWRLPSREEFSSINFSILPNLDAWVWTSKIHIDFDHYAWAYNAHYARGYFGHRNQLGSIRCVLENP